MSKKTSVLNRQYTTEFKVEAVRLVESIGGNAAAKRLAIPDSNLWIWIRLSRAGKVGEAAVRAFSVYARIVSLHMGRGEARGQLLLISRSMRNWRFSLRNCDSSSRLAVVKTFASPQPASASLSTTHLRTAD